MAKKQITIEDLAKMIKRGFDDTASNQELGAFREESHKHFERIESRLFHMDARMTVMERDIADIRKHFVYRDEFEDALARLLLVEKKLGIKSGR